MPKYKLILTVQDSFGMTKEIEAGVVDAADYELTSTEVKQIEEALPLEDYIKKVDLPEELDDYATDTEVENAIKFKTDKFVTNSFGGFSVGDSVKGLTTAEILAKLLGLVDGSGEGPSAPGVSDTPIKDAITEGSLVIYQTDEDGNVVEVPYKSISFTKETANLAPVESGFYEVTDTSGNITEYGYQHVTEPQNMFYTIALPSSVIIGENADLQTWSVMSEAWTDYDSTTLVNDFDEIIAAFEDNGLATPSVVDGYTLWADLNETNPGRKYRIVINEGE